MSNGAEVGFSLISALFLYFKKNLWKYLQFVNKLIKNQEYTIDIDKLLSIFSPLNKIYFPLVKRPRVGPFYFAHKMHTCGNTHLNEVNI